MKSDLPKVLHRVGGRALIEYVVETATTLKPDRIAVVVGHRQDLVRNHINNKKIEFAVQEPQLGTGHAVQQAMAVLGDDSGDIVVLSGDAPLLETSTLHRMIAAHRNAVASATVLTAIAPDPDAYGRIVRGADGAFLRIVEARDASEKEKAITEINSGVYCFEIDALRKALQELKADNKKGEYYLTDVIAICRQQGRKVQAVDFADFSEIRGINTRAELDAAQESLNQRGSDAQHLTF